MISRKNVATRVVYADLDSELVMLNVKDVALAAEGLSDGLSVTLSGREVVEIHMLSRFNHDRYKKIGITSNNGFMLTIVDK